MDQHVIELHCSQARNSLASTASPDRPAPLEALERDHPGITQVDRDPDGAIRIDASYLEATLAVAPETNTVVVVEASQTTEPLVVVRKARPCSCCRIVQIRRAA